MSAGELDTSLLLRLLRHLQVQVEVPDLLLLVGAQACERPGDGDLRACELRERLGNLRDYDGSWKRCWEPRERREEVDAVGRHGCWCAHDSLIHASLKASRKTMVYDVPRAYWNHH